VTFSFQVKSRSNLKETEGKGLEKKKKNQGMSATETKMRLMGKAFWGEVSAGTQQVWSTASGKWPSE
jgi:hypothetical protein